MCICVCTCVCVLAFMCAKLVNKLVDGCAAEIRTTNIKHYSNDNFLQMTDYLNNMSSLRIADMAIIYQRR